MTLSHAKEPCGDKIGWSLGLTLHHLSLMTETGAIAYEEEQFPCVKMGLWHCLYSSLKL